MTPGAVATSHFSATAAGARILEQGGSAVDAAIAAAAMLCVVYPNNVALGGDLVALVRDPSGRTTFVNATGRAALAETRDDLAARHGSAMPDRGIDTVTLPGGVRGWKALASLGGKLGWEELLAPARSAAADGHPVARSVGAAIADEGDLLGRYDGWRSVFMPGGVPLVAGDRLAQPALAESIDRIARGGPDEFYIGGLAARWLAGLQDVGSKLTADEVRAYQPTTSEAIAANAFGHRILTSPPNTQGFSLLRTLVALERDVVADPLGVEAGKLAQLFLDANRVRAAALADPDVGPTADELMTMAATEAPATPNGRGDTVGLTVVADGWAVSLVQSVYEAFGSGILDPGTGIVFQNRGTAFSLDPTAPAVFAGGRRPPHTLMPVLIERDGDLAFAQATMGGQAQPQIHAQLFLRVRDGAPVAEATAAPRWSVGARGGLLVEADVDPAARDALERTGMHVTEVPPRSEDLGHSNVIRVTEGGLEAASDPRSDGSAQVVG